MNLKSAAGKAGRCGIAIFSSLFASLLLGSFTALADAGPVLNVKVTPIVNGGMQMTAGADVTYFYQIWNTGDTPISNINVTDDQCTKTVTYDAVGQDLNVNHELDKGELWSFYCTINPTTTTTSKVTVTGQINNDSIMAVTSATVIVPPAPAGAVNGASGTSGGSNGTNTTNANSPTSSVGKLKGMPNTGLGGGASTLNFKSSVVKSTSIQSTSAGITHVPQKLEIPAIGINAKVESVGLTANGNMSAPDTSNQVAWYQLGSEPGQAGNAVIAGHLDTSTTSAGIFQNLNKLQPGDDIYVVNAQNQTLHFKVSATQTYDAATAPVQSIFGTSEESHLNLITCAGTWDKTAHQYTQRLVVYTDLVL